MADTVYSRQQVEDWQAQLQDFAKTPRTRFSKKQAVEALIEDIEAALEAHPYDEVAEKLRDWGLDIAAGSLKQYVNAYRKAHNDNAADSSHKRSGKKKKAQKKGAVNNAVKPTQKTTNNASLDDFEEDSLTAAFSSANNRTRNTSNRFLEMSEDL